MTSRLAEMQARFQQKQMQEREEKLIRLYESQQQRAFDRVSRGSAGSNSSITSSSTTGGKVRQMFDERRQKAGIDRSYPLEPLKSTKPNGIAQRSNGLNKNMTENSRTIIKTTTQKSVSHVKNGNTLLNKNSYKKSMYNNNGGEESYEEHVFENDNGSVFRSENEIIALMNNHNLTDSLDDEILPDLGVDEADDKTVARKLHNLGGISKQNDGYTKRSNLIATKVGSTVQNSTQPKQDNKPIVRKTVVRAVAPTKRQSTSSTASSIHPQPTSKPSTNSQSLPTKTSSSSMSKKVSGSARAPSTQRPSAKQSSAKSAVTRDDLEACRYCSRRFQPDRLQVHEDICAKTAKKKRKTYDATKHRLAGTDLEQFARKGTRGQSSKPLTQQDTSSSITHKKQPAKSAPKSDWRRKHEEFIAAIRSAKMAQAHVAKGGKLSDLPPPPPSTNPDYVQCPHCGRRFNETAAERHIPKCATYEFNKPSRPVQKKAASGRAFR